MVTAAELMSTSLITLHEQDLLDDAERWLELAHIRHLPVVRGKKLVGLITHRDLIGHAATATDPRRPVRAGEVMNREVTCIRPDTPMSEAIPIMLHNKFGCLPVTTSSGTLVGIITESDLLKFAERRFLELDQQELAAKYE
jgi:CBS domain-containing membrane protein